MNVNCGAPLMTNSRCSIVTCVLTALMEQIGVLIFTAFMAEMLQVKVTPKYQHIRDIS